MRFCKHDNIEIAYKCMDCQEEEFLAEDERREIWGESIEEYTPMGFVEEVEEFDDCWPEKIDALEVL